MAYQNKYKATFATKTGKTAYLYLQEDSYVGDVIEYQGVDLSLQYIPTSDDPFEPIFASQLNIILDITDEETGNTSADMPDFTTLNDRKYLTKLYLDEDLEWCGWVLSDNVQVTYSTGRKQIGFNAIDGLGLLKSIPLPIADSINTNEINTLLYYLLLSLNSIEFQDDLNLMTICSYYSTEMDNRSIHAYSEPFNQSYLPYRTFIDNNVYISCLDVITNIAKSFGCRLFQASGKWWIVAINEFANVNAYFTEYTSAVVVSDYGTIDTLSTIEGFNGNTSGLYFIDNSQMKLLKKGYNRIEQNVKSETANNYISNGNFRPYTGAFADNWNSGTVGGVGNSVTIISNDNETFASYRLTKGSTTGDNAFFEIKSGSYPKIIGGVKLEFSWIFQGQDLGASPRGFVYLYITDGTYYWWWNGTTWVSTSQFMIIPAYSGGGGDAINSYSFKTAVTPIAGELHFKYSIESGTGNFVQISNMQLKITPLISEVYYFSYLTSNLDYVKTIDIPYGSFTSGSYYPVEKGIILLSNGNNSATWYEYGSESTYDSLLSLIVQKYTNIYAKNIINIDCNLSSFSTTNGILNASKLIKADDIDPIQINVSDKSYMIGNATISYARDETQATLLEISNIDIENTNGYEITYNVLI